MSQRLIERFISTGKLIEADRSKLSTGILCKARYQICSVGEKNRNNRIYERAVWEKVLGDADVQEKLKNRSLFFHAEHPEESQSNTEKVAGVVSSLDMDEKNVYATMEVLDTPYGRIVDTLLKAGCGIGVSTRADGELEECLDEQGNKYSRVIPESYRFVTVDFTADPSSYGSELPIEVQRGVTRAVKSGLDNESMDRKYATVLLEHLNVSEAKTILESMKIDKHHAGCKCKPTEKHCLNCGHVEESVNEKGDKKQTVGKFEIELWDGREDDGVFTVHLSEYSKEGKHEVDRADCDSLEKAEQKFAEYVKKAEGLKETIVKKGSKWQVQSHSGKNMGTYDTEAEAKKRLGQVEFFKHKNEGIEESDDWCSSYSPVSESISEGKSHYLVIPGLNDKLDDSYKHTNASSEDKAISNIVTKICKAVDAGEISHKSWKFGDWFVSFKNKSGIIKYILDNKSTLVKTHTNESLKANPFVVIDGKTYKIFRGEGMVAEVGNEEAKIPMSSFPVDVQKHIIKRLEEDDNVDDLVGAIDNATNIAKNAQGTVRVTEESVQEVKIRLYADGKYLSTTTKYPTVNAAIAALKDTDTLDVAGRKLTGKDNPVSLKGKKITGEIVKESEGIEETNNNVKKWKKRAEEYYSKINYVPDQEDIYDFIAGAISDEVGINYEEAYQAVVAELGEIEEAYSGVATRMVKEGQYDYQYMDNLIRVMKRRGLSPTKAIKIITSSGVAEETATEHVTLIYKEELGESKKRFAFAKILEGREGPDLKELMKEYYKDVVTPQGEIEEPMTHEQAIKHLALVTMRSEKEVEALLKENMQMAITAPAQISQYLGDNWSNFANDDEAVNNLVSTFHITPAKAKEYVLKQQQGETPLVASYMVEAKLKEKHMKLAKNYAKDAIFYGKNIGVLQEKLKQADKIFEKTASDLENKIVENQQLVIKIESITGKNSELTEKVASTETELKAIKEKAEKDVSSLKEKHQVALVEMYTKTKIKCMGLRLPERCLALLGQCETTHEVDATIRQFQNAVTESALHLSGITGIEVRETVEVDPVQASIDTKVEKAMSAWTGKPQPKT